MVATIPVINSTNELNSHQFENRYSLYCHDPFEYQPVNNELIARLAIELKAVNPIIVSTLMSSGREGRYLTADSFDILQPQINEREENKDFLAEGYGAYLFEVLHPAFYKGYPKLFWIDCDTNRFDIAFNEYGEVSYQQPINKFAVPRF